MASIYQWVLVFVVVPAFQVPAAAVAAAAAVQRLNLNSLCVPRRFG